MSVTPEEFLARYSPQVCELGLLARQLILSVLEGQPNVTEIVDLPDTVLAYTVGPKMRDRVFYISVHKAHANIGFFGVGLPDPEGIVEGTGKRLRHVKLRKPEDVSSPALRTVLETALAQQLGE